MINALTRRAVLLPVLFLTACNVAPQTEDIAGVSAERALELDRALADVMEQHEINTAGIAVIKQGDVVWSTYYGQQSPGIPASSQTLFNVASLTKTVVAETVLRLAADGELSLDESMSTHWLDPDLEDDPRHEQLTPRMALSHTTGFMNWRYFSEDGTLGFVSEPGTRHGYSGEGFNYLARFAEAKLGEPFEDLAQRYVFEPAGVSDAALSVQPDLFERIAQPLDADGQFPGHYCRPEGRCRDTGSFSAAGGMVITLEDFARFLIATMSGDGLTSDLLTERNTMHSDQELIDCNPVPEALCPTRVGYGLGWNIYEVEDAKTIGHRGSDWSMVTLAYYYEDSQDALVVLFNAPNPAGMAAMVDVLRLLDPDSPELHGYIARRDRTRG
ncbi:MAG: serine hydrolase domain-containing protein [Bacteroidota bacterium]